MTHPTDALRLVPRRAVYDWLRDDVPLNVKMTVMPHHIDALLDRLSKAAPASPLPGGGDILWMMHVRGPDDIYPAPDYDTAVAWCDYVNDVLAKRLPDVMMKAVPAVYPRTREEHAAGLPDAIKGWTLPAAPTGEPK